MRAAIRTNRIANPQAPVSSGLIRAPRRGPGPRLVRAFRRRDLALQFVIDRLGRQSIVWRVTPATMSA